MSSIMLPMVCGSLPKRLPESNIWKQESNNTVSIINSVDGKDEVPQLMIPGRIEEGQNKQYGVQERDGGKAAIDSELEVRNGPVEKPKRA